MEEVSLSPTLTLEKTRAVILEQLQVDPHIPILLHHPLALQQILVHQPETPLSKLHFMILDPILKIHLQPQHLLQLLLQHQLLLQVVPLAVLGVANKLLF